MEIKAVLNLDVGIENLTLNCVKIESIYEPVKGEGKVKNGKKLPDWIKQSFKVKDLSGETTVNTFKFTLDKNLIGKHVKLTGVTIGEYKGEKHLSCQAWELVETESKQEPINKHEEPAKTGLKESLTKQETKPDWDAKDMRMARMNALAHATEIVVRMAGASTADVTMQVMIEAEKLVDFIYNGLNKDVDGIPF